MENAEEKAAFDDMNKMFSNEILDADKIVRKEEKIAAQHEKENAAIHAAKQFYLRDKIAGILAEMKELGIESLEHDGETILDVDETRIAEIKLIPKRF